MRRVLSIILVLVFSFAAITGCSEKKDPASPTQSSAAKATQAPPTTPVQQEQTKPETEPAAQAGISKEDLLAGYEQKLKERTSSGEKVFVGIIPPTLTAQRLSSICQYVSDYITGLGGTAQITSAERKEENFITLIENFVTMEASAILVIAQQTDAIEDICKRAMDSGTYIIMLGVSPKYDVSGILQTDFYETGKMAANMLLKWIHDTYADAAPDSVPVAIAGNITIDDGVKRTNAFLETIEADDLAFVDFHIDMKDATNAEEAWSVTQDALTYNPDLRCFLYYEIDGAIGGNNYITGIPGVDLSEFCLACVGQNAAGWALIEQSETNDRSCLRGSISYGGEQPGIQLSEIILRLINGEQPPIRMYDEIYTYNRIGFEVN